MFMKLIKMKKNSRKKINSGKAIFAKINGTVHFFLFELQFVNPKFYLRLIVLRYLILKIKNC